MTRIEHALLPAVAAAAIVLAGAGWMRSPARQARPVRSISIVDVRPLRLDDPALRPITSHLFAVRVATPGWTLLRYKPGATAADNRADAGHWRLYLDGHPLGNSYGSSHVGYTPYLTPGTHWIAAELRNIDSSRLGPAVWSEPVVLHVPEVIRCWQTGWNGTRETGIPLFTCRQRPGT